MCTDVAADVVGAVALRVDAASRAQAEKGVVVRDQQLTLFVFVKVWRGCENVVERAEYASTVKELHALVLDYICLPATKQLCPHIHTYILRCLARVCADNQTIVAKCMYAFIYFIFKNKQQIWLA
jgi:hypothetical protein